MIIGVPKELNKKSVLDEVENFAKKYKLSTEEKAELAFIMNTFCKYYNKMSDNSSMLSQEDIIESFESVLETITETYNGTGTKTRANLFWKEIPCVQKMIKDSADTASKKTAKKSTHETDVFSYPPAHSPSYSSSYHSSSYSYGGCGGSGGGYSGGGHC